MTTISILGCGWLGLPLGEFLSKKGYRVKGSTISLYRLEEIRKKDIAPYLVILDPDIRGDYTDFLESDILVINLPPERRDDIVEYHQKQIKSLLSELQISPIQRVLFVSSTSVYPGVNREVTENDSLIPSKKSGKALIKVEELLQECEYFKSTVVRFGGLIGYDRMPGRFLSGKKEVKNGDAAVNLIHRDDCIQIIYEIIRQNVWGEILNACADLHPKRRDYYTEQAKAIGMAPPKFIEEQATKYKVVSSGKLKRVLNYEFKYPDPSRIKEN